jgi:hypothetical protein
MQAPITTSVRSQNLLASPPPCAIPIFIDVTTPTVARAAQAHLVRWAAFFNAHGEHDLEELARRDPIMQRAKSILEQLSTEPSAQEAARQRGGSVPSMGACMRPWSRLGAMDESSGRHARPGERPCCTRWDNICFLKATQVASMRPYLALGGS